MPMTTAEIARLLNGHLSGDGNIEISGLAKIEEAGPHDLSFVANERYVRFLETTGAGAVLARPGTSAATCAVIEVADPYLSFQQLLNVFHPLQAWLPAGIHPTAVIAPDATIGADVTVGAYCFIGPRCRIGAGSVVYPHVTISADVEIGAQCEIHSQVSLREGVHLGARVVIQDGVVVGSDGFGFAPGAEGYQKIPQRGIVVIEDDVEIGANTTIDRATLGATIIKRGTKLDNLIQIAHNVSIGEHTVIAAQTGISGSAKIGNWCQIGGQTGIVGHIQVGDRVMMGAKTGIAGDVASGEIISGAPARAHSLWKRIEASLTRLPDLFKRVRALETAVFESKGKSQEDH
jgi:UDP-3-O-[3-hydroxymyristoyl] glucosamine N-acyltransferase